MAFRQAAGAFLVQLDWNRVRTQSALTVLPVVLPLAALATLVGQQLPRSSQVLNFKVTSRTLNILLYKFPRAPCKKQCYWLLAIFSTQHQRHAAVRAVLVVPDTLQLHQRADARAARAHPDRTWAQAASEAGAAARRMTFQIGTIRQIARENT